MNSIKFIEERTESNDQEEAMEIFRKALHDVFKDKNNDNKDNVNEEIENEIILFAFGYLSENFISIVFDNFKETLNDPINFEKLQISIKTYMGDFNQFSNDVST